MNFYWAFDLTYNLKQEIMALIKIIISEKNKNIESLCQSVSQTETINFIFNWKMHIKQLN